MRIQELLFGWLSSDSRVFIGLIVVIVALFGLLALSSMRFVRIVLESLDITAFIGLFLVNWIGNGGILVPIPGERFIGLLMIFQNAVLFPSWEVFAISGAAMGLGLLSYYIAGARTAHAYAAGDTETASQLAKDTGMIAEADRSNIATTPGLSITGPADAVDAASTGDSNDGGRGGLRRRFSESFKHAQERAEPVIAKHGVLGMFLLCFGPSPLGTAAAFLGGLMRFGFTRYLAASFASKYLLAGIVVVAGLIFSEAARSVQLPF